MLIPEPPLQVLPTLAVAIGLNEALFLQQLHYWLRMSPHVFEGQRWVYNDYKDWHAQFPFWSERTLRRVINRLEKPFSGCDRPLILTTTQFNRHPMDQTKWYTADYDALDDLCTHMETDAGPTDPTLPGSPPDFIVSQGMIRPSGHSGQMGWPDDPAPIGHNGQMVCPDGPAPIGHNGQMVCPEWPAPTGQLGHLSLQRLPETTNRETHTPYARVCEVQEGEGNQPPETPESHTPSAPPTDAHATSCGEDQTPGDDSPEPCSSSHLVSSDLVTRPEPACTVGVPSPPHGSELPPSAAGLVQRFYQEMYSITDKTPDAKELGHARSLMAERGPEFATFFVYYACKTAREEGFKPNVFGGLMRYKGAALAVYDRHHAQQAKASAQAAEARESYLQQQYERDCQTQVMVYRASLSPERLGRLEEEVRTELTEHEEIHPSVFGARLKAELHLRLLTGAGVPSFNDWREQREARSQDPTTPPQPKEGSDDN